MQDDRGRAAGVEPDRQAEGEPGSNRRHSSHSVPDRRRGARLQPNVLLTADMFERARRRLEELPDRTTARIALRPEADNFASVDVVVVERGGLPRSGAEWTAAGARAVTRSVTVSAPGSTGQGEVWSADWRFWQNRPRVGLAFATPRAGGLPGVWRVDASWEGERFAASGLGAAATGIAIAWRAHRQRLADGTPPLFDERRIRRMERRRRKALRRRRDRAALARGSRGARGARDDWMGVGSSRVFRRGAPAPQSSSELRGWVALATPGADRVSDRAARNVARRRRRARPRAAAARDPLLDDGVIELGPSSVFGRSLRWKR